jgi:hypothetical protein
VHRRLPSASQLARLVLVVDALAAGGAYEAWRWTQAHGPLAGLRLALGLGVAALVVAALLLRRLVYRSSSWEPPFLVALAAAAATPLVGGWILRGALAADARVRPQPGAVALPYRTSAARLGNAKRLSDL